MSDTLQSRPFRPNPDVCCEACVFLKGEHAAWCPKRTPPFPFPVTIDSRVPQNEVWIISGFGKDLLVNKTTNLLTPEDQSDK